MTFIIILKLKTDTYQYQNSLCALVLKSNLKINCTQIRQQIVDTKKYSLKYLMLEKMLIVKLMNELK